MKAFKFLQTGAAGRFSGRTWPRPGEADPWVAAEAIDLCRSGVHACRAADLSYWIDDELWTVELDGAVAEAEHLVLAPRARLLERVTAWNPNLAERFAFACADRAHGYATLATDQDHPAAAAATAAAASSTEHAQLYANQRQAISFAAFASYSAAVTAGHLDPAGGAARERELQAGWLLEELRLDA